MLQKIHFRAVDGSGKFQEGIVEAESVEAAVLQLNAKAMQVFAAKVASSRRFTIDEDSSTFRNLFGGPNLAWRAKLYRQLAILLHAGIAIDRALRMLADQAPKAWEKKLLNRLVQGVAAGQALSAVISTSIPNAGPDEAGLIKVAEKSGTLSQALSELNTMMERRKDIRSRIFSALVYPAFLLMLAPVALIIVATVLVPNIAPLFETTGAEMPWSLRAMVVVGRSWQNGKVIWLVGAVGVLASVLIIRRNANIRQVAYDLLRKLPLFHSLRSKAFVASLCRPLANLLKSGAPLQNAIAAVEETFGMGDVRTRLANVRTRVSSGARFSTSLAAEKLVAGSALQMISVGEETNQLEVMLQHVADASEKELQDGIDRLMTLLVPVLTIAMGLLIGGIMMSVMRAILAVNQLAAQ
jgi:general secretion pathway protein F